MSRKTKAGLPVARPDAAYEVGYGKPPVSSRFKPGQSGNPRGRPKGAKSGRPRLNEARLAGIVLEEAYRTITVKDGHRQVTIPIAQAVIRSLSVNAAKGQHRAQRLFTEMLGRIEAGNKAMAQEIFETAMEYKQGWEQELRRRERHQITDLPEPLPHPDQIAFDPWTGEVVITGPCSPKEAEALGFLRGRLTEFEDERAWLVTHISQTKDAKMRALFEEDLARTERILSLISARIEEFETVTRVLTE